MNEDDWNEMQQSVLETVVADLEKLRERAEGGVA